MPAPSSLVTLAEPDRVEALALLTRIYVARNRRRSGEVHVPTTIPRERIAWLAARGLAPNQRRDVTHDQLVRAVRGARITVRDGARAFVASLAGGGPPHGCYLELALLAARMPAHRRTGAGDSCDVCGAPARVVRDRAEEFLSWHAGGTGIPGDLAWCRLALDHWPRRSRGDRTAPVTLAAVLVALDRLAPTARAGEAIRAVERLGVPHARAIVETLAFAGVLEAPPRVGLATRFVTFRERDERPSVRVEVDAPLGFWRGANGVTWPNVERVFGFDRAAVVAVARRRRAPSGVAPRASRRVVMAAASARGLGLPRRPAARGDIWALRVREDAWLAVYVWAVETRGQRPYAVLEYLDSVGAAAPGAEDLAGRGVRGRRGVRWQMRGHSLARVRGSVLVAARVRPPAARIAFGGPTQAANGLLHLWDWCFPELG